MSRREARKRVEADEFSWADMKQIMTDVRAEVELVQRNPSRINPGLSIATAYNIFKRSLDAVDGSGRPKRGGMEILAINILREFGMSNGCLKRPKRRVIDVHQEPLISETDEQ